MVKVAVVRPSVDGCSIRPARMPQDFALLPALTPETVELSYYDEWLDPLPELFAEDAVALMVDARTAHRAQTLADRCRQQGRTVLMWGQYPAGKPDEAKRYADSVLCGGPFSTWRAAMDDLATCALQPFYKESSEVGPVLADYDYNLFAPGLYPTGAVISVDMAAAPPDEVAKVPQRRLHISDKSFFMHESLVESWLAGIAPLGKHWACHIGTKAAQNPRLLQQMREAGCSLVILNAAEMGMPGGLGGALCSPTETVRNIHEAGLMIQMCFVFSEDMREKDVAEALAFARKHRLAGACFAAVPEESRGALAGQCREAEQRFSSAWGRWWRWVACRANRKQFVAYQLLQRSLNVQQ